VGIGASAGGLEAIKEKDGIVLVQSPDSTKFAGMPECGLETVIADIETPAEGLPVRLINFLNHIPVLKKKRIG